MRAQLGGITGMSPHLSHMWAPGGACHDYSVSSQEKKLLEGMLGSCCRLMVSIGGQLNRVRNQLGDMACLWDYLDHTNCGAKPTPLQLLITLPPWAAVTGL